MTNVMLFPGTGGGSPSNVDDTYQFYGISSAGAPTTITANASANTKGNYSEIVSSTTDAMSGFWIIMGPAGTTAARFLLDIATGGAGSEVVMISNLYCAPSTNQSFAIQWVPINVAAATRIAVRCQASVGGGSGGTIGAVIIGPTTNANSRPLYSSCDTITTADTTNTRPNSTTTITFTGSSGTWTQLVASTARQYGSVAMIVGPSSATPALIQPFTASLATGAAASEVIVWRWPWIQLTSSPTFSKWAAPTMNKTIAASTRLSAELVTTTPGTDSAQIQLLGFY